MKRPRIRMETNSAGEAEISIFGPIGGDGWGGGVSLAQLQEALDQVPAASQIKLLLNSPGGDAFDGMAMYNLLSRVRDRLTVEVLGWAASAASVVALAGKDLVMGEGSYLMIHEPWAITIGPADDHRKMAEDLDKMVGAFADFYAAHSDLPRADILEAMKAETWYTAQEAVDAGFATSVSDSAAIAASSTDFAEFRYKRVPDGLGTTAASADREVPRTAKGFEQLLRESGYSRSEATALAARGAKALLPERESRVAPETAVPASSEIERPEPDGAVSEAWRYQAERTRRLRGEAA